MQVKSLRLREWRRCDGSLNVNTFLNHPVFPIPTRQENSPALRKKAVIKLIEKKM